MYRISLTLIFLTFFTSLTLAETHFTAYSKILLDKLKKNEFVSEKTKKEFLIHSELDTDFILGTIWVEENFNENLLLKEKITVNSKVRDIWTVKIPLNKAIRLKEIEGIKLVQFDSPLKSKLDQAIYDTNVDLVHQGSQLSQSYFGDGVIVGIVDGGFDFTHPTFYDSTGTNYRVSKVWLQNLTGNPPSGYNYGTELVGNTAILNTLKDMDNQTHGTHVAGIAGGSGFGTNNLYRGVAPSSELVFVSTGEGQSLIIDAINYIFNYASSVGKPAVINMSLGTHIGPHDGTSLNDLAFDNLSGNGKILVGAAGNEGGKKLHLSHNFSQLGDTVGTVIYFEDTEAQTGNGIIELWGSPNSDFSVGLEMISTNFDELDELSFINASSNSSTQDLLVFGTDTIKVNIATVGSSPTNQRPNIQLNIENPTNNYVVLVFTSSNGEVHIWNHGQGNGAELTDLSLGFLLAGNTTHTVGEIGGTSQSVITVGAYTTKNTYFDITGQQQPISQNAPLGQIAPFSSKGPTLDNRVKPEITAPGNVIASSYSKFDTTLGSSQKVLLVSDGTNIWPYGVLEGTSMATPFVTGVIALMLEANSSINKTQIINTFKSQATKDSFTGNIPTIGSNVWGFGKVEAHNFVTDILTSIDTNFNQKIGNYQLLKNYPNPFNPSTQIEFSLPKNGFVSIRIFNVLGQEIKSLVSSRKNAGNHKIIWNGTDKNNQVVSSGIYFYKFEVENFSQTRKMLFLK